MSQANTTPRQRRLIELWEQHVGFEFDSRDIDATLDTMVSEAYVNHVPVMTGGRGREELREFYGNSFIPRMPPDTRMTPISRTVGDNTSCQSGKVGAPSLSPSACSDGAGNPSDSQAAKRALRFEAGKSGNVDIQDAQDIHGVKGLVARLKYMSGRYPCSIGGVHFG